MLTAAAFKNEREAIEAGFDFGYNGTDYSEAMWSLLDKINKEEGLNLREEHKRRLGLAAAKPVNPQD